MSVKGLAMNARTLQLENARMLLEGLFVAILKYGSETVV